MKTRTICSVPSSYPRLDHSHKVLALGSCFAQNIGEELAQRKFDILINPVGITYNPVSLLKQCQLAVSGDLPPEHLYVQGLDDGTYHLDYHSDVSARSKTAWLASLDRINKTFCSHLEQSDWCLITLGTAWAYSMGVDVVANCHKQPARQFDKQLLQVSTCVEAIEGIINLLPSSCQVLLTVSPVRHVRDGLIENNRSKARLIEAVHQVVERRSQAYYFPAYELVIDDLRDYRYYNDDLVHPDHMAINYVWSHLVEALMTDPTRTLVQEIDKVRQAMSHRPRWPESQQHQDFLSQMLKKVQVLADRYPAMEWLEEIRYFSADQNTGRG